VAQHVSGRMSMRRRSKAKPSADSVVRGEDEKVQMTGGSISI
jgi:hypothetical protein